MSLWDFFSRKDAKDLFLEFDPEGAKFSTVTWNFDLTSVGERRFTVEIDKEKKELIDWQRGDLEEVRFLLGGRLLRKRRIPAERHELVKLMNLSIHATVRAGLEAHKDFIRTPVTGVTTLDYESEARALQWVQASFGTLSRALKKVQSDDGMILTAAFFSGEEPSTGNRVLRLIAFNLDVVFYFQADDGLRILVFDDKNLGQGQAKNPVFQQIIKVTKPQFYDEIIKLTHEVATVGELK